MYVCMYVLMYVFMYVYLEDIIGDKGSKLRNSTLIDYYVNFTAVMVIMAK